MKFPTHTLSLSGLLALTCGCVAGPNMAAGTAMGTGFGAVTGAMIGHESGHAGGGALIGAAAGALAGGLIGTAEDARFERDAALAHAEYSQAAAHAQAQALHNRDLALMTQNGISDDVIITAVNTRGGQFDLSPGAIVQLKNSGVSDGVILAVQRASAAGPSLVVPPGPVYYPAPAYYPGPPPGPEVVIVPARPRVDFEVVFGRPHHHGHHHHRHWHH